MKFAVSVMASGPDALNSFETFGFAGADFAASGFSGFGSFAFAACAPRLVAHPVISANAATVSRTLDQFDIEHLR